MSKVTIDLDTSGTIDLSNIGLKEKRTVKFTRPDNPWSDDYLLTVYSSPNKDNPKPLPDDLEIAGNDMMLTFEPTRQELPEGNRFYEVFNNTQKLIEFKGDLKIKK